MGAASHSCPLSGAVGVWTTVSHVVFDMQTSMCRCLLPSLYAIEGERFISRGCLDIPRACPSSEVLYRAHFSIDTLGGLTNSDSESDPGTEPRGRREKTQTVVVFASVPGRGK